MLNDPRQDWLHRVVAARVLGLPVVLWFVLATAVSIGAIVEGCGNGASSPAGTAGTTSMATVSIKVSDPSTCTAPNGPFGHV